MSQPQHSLLIRALGLTGNMGKQKRIGHFICIPLFGCFVILLQAVMKTFSQRRSWIFTKQDSLWPTMEIYIVIVINRKGNVLI